ncbi:MAG TPA: demethoxyubiquinone hydroxylase family protein [Azospirillum sp.]|nr:demethoxyubiquinone hydroxylase family protein [Azospirillum sp.]
MTTLPVQHPATETAPARRVRGALPGDPRPQERIARICRVDHAGEYGAKRIYEGQLAVMGKGRHGRTLRHMAEQEREHLRYFEGQLARRRVRPTALHPVWHVGGYLLGVATALLGERAAMACTVAVEEVIDGHYAGQLDHLGPEEAELKGKILAFQAEELEHRDIGLANGAEQAPGYPLLSGAIRLGTRAAIWIAERF